MWVIIWEKEEDPSKDNNRVTSKGYLVNEQTKILIMEEVADGCVVEAWELFEENLLNLLNGKVV